MGLGKLRERSLELRLRYYPESDPLVLRGFENLGAVRLAQKQYAEARRLFESIWETSRVHGMEELPASAATYFTFRDEGRTFQDVGLWSTGLDNITSTRYRSAMRRAGACKIASGSQRGIHRLGPPPRW